MDYQQFLENKLVKVKPSGFNVLPETLNSNLFQFQRDIVQWALSLGRAAIFAQVGMGKTIMQLVWAYEVARHTDGSVLVLAPLAVSHQTVREGEKFGITVRYVSDMDAVHSGHAEGVRIFITNYERLEKFQSDFFHGVVLDESSILKSFTGKTKQSIITAFEATPYKLACTATPAPNDHMELGNHSEFLGVLPSNEMLMRWFVNDTMKAGGYRIKGHAEKDFWRWLTSWAVCITRPSDLGDYDDSGYNLPKLNILDHYIPANQKSIDLAQSQGRLLPDTAPSSTELGRVKRLSLDDRVAKTVEIINSIDSTEPILIWCNMNDEADAICKAIPNAVEVRGSDKPEQKAQKLLDFTDGKIRILVTKASIAGFGMNWQHCNQMIFFGIDFSFESFYQAKGRTHRYGQKREVNCHVIYSELEGNVIATLYQKQADFLTMQSSMAKSMSEFGLFRDGKVKGYSDSSGNMKMVLPHWLISKV